MMPLAFVTGANGAIGRHTVAQLKRADWIVGGVGHGPVNWVDDSPIDYWLAGDVSSESLDVLAERLGAPSLVIHLAGGSAVGPSLAMPLGDFERTVTATIRVLDWVRGRSPYTRVVAVSSAAVYGGHHSTPIAEDIVPQPVSPYGHHKLMMEQLVQYWGNIFGLSAIIARPFSVYGVGLQKQLVFDLTTRLSMAPERLVLSGTGEEMRDWISIRDSARLLIELAAFASTNVPVYNLCVGQGRSVAELANMLAQAWGHGTEIAFDGISRPGDPLYLVGSNSRLQSASLQAHVSLEEGLAEVVAAARNLNKRI